MSSNQYQWIINVLTDLKTFAQENNMPALAEQLETTLMVAVAELPTENADDLSDDTETKAETEDEDNNDAPENTNNHKK